MFCIFLCTFASVTYNLTTMKKTLLLTLLLAIAGIFTLSSCATKASAIDDLRQLSEQVRDNGAYYTVKDWKRTAQRYNKIADRLSKYDYTTAEMAEIGRLKGQCAGYFATGVIDNVGGKVINAASLIKGFIEGVKEAVER